MSYRTIELDNDYVIRVPCMLLILYVLYTNTVQAGTLSILHCCTAISVILRITSGYDISR